MSNTDHISNLSGGLLANSTGNYTLLPSGAAYCSGIVPDPGFEVVRAELQPWLPLERAYDFIEGHLASIGRPVQAFCGIELRLPRPLSMGDWSAFNVPYLDRLRKWGLMASEFSCVCRSNIALDLYPPQTTSMCAFSYTLPSAAMGKTFLLSGQADIASGGKIIAEGNTDSGGMQERTRFVIETVGQTLEALHLNWQDTTRIALFHAHEIPDLWGPHLLGRIGEPVRRGVLIYRARPPIAGGEVELEARAVRQDLVVVAG